MYNSSLLKRGKTPFDILPSGGDSLPDYKTYQRNPRIHSVGESYELQNYLANPIGLDKQDRMNVNEEYNRFQASNGISNEINGQLDEHNDRNNVRNNQERQINPLDKYEIEIKGTRSVYSRKFNGLASPLEQWKQQTDKKEQRQQQQEDEPEYVNPFRSAKKQQNPASRQSIHLNESTKGAATLPLSLQAPMFQSQHIFNEVPSSSLQQQMNPKRSSNGFPPSIPVYETEEIPEFRQTLSSYEKQNQVKSAETSNFAEQKSPQAQPLRFEQYKPLEKEPPSQQYERILTDNQQRQQLQLEKPQSQILPGTIRFSQQPPIHREQVIRQLAPEVNLEPQQDTSSLLFQALPNIPQQPIEITQNYPPLFGKNETSPYQTYPFSQQQEPIILPSPSLPIEQFRPVPFAQSQPQFINQPPPIVPTASDNMILQPREIMPSHFVSFEPQLASPQPIISPVSSFEQQEVFQQQPQFNKQQYYPQIQQQQQPIQSFQQTQQPLLQTFPNYLQSYQPSVLLQQQQQQQFASQQILPVIENAIPLQIQQQQPYFPAVIETPQNYPTIQTPYVPSNLATPQPRLSLIQSPDNSFPSSGQFSQSNPYDKPTRILGREQIFTKQQPEYSPFDKSTTHLPANANPYFQKFEEPNQQIPRYQQEVFNSNDVYSFQQPQPQQQQLQLQLQNEADMFQLEKPQVFLRGAKYF